MQISAVGFTPYIYNTNTISALSMNRIAAIPGDVTEQKIDYTGLTSDESENINPLGIGQSANFMDILSSQMSMSRYHQARIMKDMRPMEEEPFDTRENTQMMFRNGSSCRKRMRSSSRKYHGRIRRTLVKTCLTGAWETASLFIRGTVHWKLIA